MSMVVKLVKGQVWSFNSFVKGWGCGFSHSLDAFWIFLGCTGENFARTSLTPSAMNPWVLWLAFYMLKRGDAADGG